MIEKLFASCAIVLAAGLAWAEGGYVVLMVKLAALSWARAIQAAMALLALGLCCPLHADPPSFPPVTFVNGVPVPSGDTAPDVSQNVDADAGPTPGVMPTVSLNEAIAASVPPAAPPPPKQNEPRSVFIASPPPPPDYDPGDKATWLDVHLSYTPTMETVYQLPGWGGWPCAASPGPRWGTVAASADCLSNRAALAWLCRQAAHESLGARPVACDVRQHVWDGKAWQVRSVYSEVVTSW